MEPTPGGVLVYVVDDQDAVCAALSKVVSVLGYETQSFRSAAAFLEAVRLDRPACLLLDVFLAEENGFDLLAELERRRMQLPTVFMTGGGTIPMGVQAIKAGAIEFLTKPLEFDVLRAALEQAAVLANAQYSRRAEELALRERLRRLTPRENAVLPYVVRGVINKQIAAELSIVEKTVKVHRTRVMKKLEVGTVADLVRLAERCGDFGIQLTPTNTRSH